MTRTITTVAGGWNGDGGSALEAVLSTPHGLAFDSDGNLYIAECDGHRIRRVDASGVITTIAGTGEGGFFDDSGRATESTLCHPEAVAVDRDGSVYIADTLNDRVRRVDRHGAITTVAGSDGDSLGGDGGPALEAALKWPGGVAVAADGSIVIADSGNNRVCRLGRDGCMTTVAGTEEHEGPWGVDGPATETVVLSPRGLAVGRDGSLYVTDGGSFVRRVDPAGTITTIPGADETDNPCALALGDDGSLYIAEAAAERVRRVDPDGATTTVAGTGRHGFSGDGGPAVDAGLGLPNGVAVAPDGSIYIADTWNDRIRRVDADGTITTVAGRGDTPFADKRLATEVPLEASGVAIAPDGSIHVAAHRCVHRIDGDRVIASVAGTGVQGYSGDGGPAVEAELHEAHAIAFGPDGSLYIADCGEQVVRRVAPDGTITTFAGTGPDDDCEEPDPGVADDADALWAWYGRDGGPATGARLVGPWDVAVDAAGNVYIADSENIRITDDVGVESHRIRRVGTDGLITTFAGVGVSGFSGDGGPATKARLGDPTGVAVGPDGSVYIADQDTNRIRRVDPNGVITTVAGTGKERYSGDGGPATKAALDSPEKIAFDREGNLFIADRYNNRVRRVGRDGVITTLAGSGEAGSSGDGGPATEARLTPIALAVGPDGAVYVADDYGRVRLVSHARS